MIRTRSSRPSVVERPPRERSARRGLPAASVLVLVTLASCSPGNTDTVIPVNGSTTSQSTVGTAVPLTVVTPDLKGWVDTNGRYFTVQTIKLQAFGGSPQGGYTWTVRSDQPLPFSTLSLDSNTGVFSGTLPSTAHTGRYNFGVNVSDGTSQVTAQFSLLVDTCASTTSAGGVDQTACHVKDALSAAPGSGTNLVTVLYGGSTGNIDAFGSGNAFGFAFPATGGTLPYGNWRVISGSVPPGLQIETVRGVLYGTPTTSAQGNTYTFTVATTDATGTSDPAAGGSGTAYSLKIGKPQ